MSYKFFYLYIVAAVLGLLLGLYKILKNYPAINFQWELVYLIPSLLLFYLAYKVYHEKKDKELM